MTVCPFDIELPSVMSNFDREVDAKVAHALKTEPAFAHYPGWNFNARVWWDRSLGQWACEVWVYGVPDEKLVHGHTLEDIMEQVSESYGSE